MARDLSPPADELSLALEALEPAFRPRLRLFLSIDLVGSTTYKSSAKGQARTAAQGARWIKDLLDFYREFPKTLARCVADCNAEKPLGLMIETPELWKSKGDELLFSIALSSPDEATLLIHSWKRAVEAYGETLRTEIPSLDVKSVAWVAGFPILNMELFFLPADREFWLASDALSAQYQLRREYYDKTDIGRALTRDFLGPSIDIGFRLAELCSPRKLMLSLELAWILCQATQVTNVSSELGYYFDGAHPLKGVANGVPYPQIWLGIEALSALDKKALDLQPRQEAKPPAKILDYLDAYYARYQPDSIKPFIVGCAHANMNTPPGSYMDTLATLQASTREELGRAEAVRDSARADSEGGGGDMSPELKKALTRIGSDKKA